MVTPPHMPARLSLGARSRKPRRYDPFIEPTGNHKGSQGTARGQQREDQAHRPGERAQAVESDSAPSRVGLVTPLADRALFLAQVNVHVALALLPYCRALRIRIK